MTQSQEYLGSVIFLSINKINELENQISELQKRNDSQAILIDQQTKDIARLKGELEQLKKKANK
jgi:precorrin-4 methylase